MERLTTDLQTLGIRCWSFIRTHDIRNVSSTHTETRMRFQDLFFPVLSTIPGNDVPKEIRGAPKEVKMALEREQREQRTILFPIFLTKEALESPLSWVAELREQGRAFDFTNWQDEKSYRHSLDVLLQKLREHEAKRMQM